MSTGVLSLGWGLLAVVIDIASSVFLSCSTLNFWSFFNTVLWRRLSLSIFCLSQHIPMHVSLASELGMLWVLAKPQSYGTFNYLQLLSIAFPLTLESEDELVEKLISLFVPHVPAPWSWLLSSTPLRTGSW